MLYPLSTQIRTVIFRSTSTTLCSFHLSSLFHFTYFEEAWPGKTCPISGPSKAMAANNPLVSSCSAAGGGVPSGSLVSVNPVTPVPGIHKETTGEQNGQHQKDQRTALALKILSFCESFKPDPKCCFSCDERQNNAFIPGSFFPICFCSTVKLYFPLTK